MTKKAAVGSSRAGNGSSRKASRNVKVSRNTGTRTEQSVRTEQSAASRGPLAVALLEPIEVAERAYYLYLARGAAPGGELGDWIQAERELRSARGLG